MPRYLRMLAEHGIDADARGSISTSAAFGAATIAVHANPAAKWDWQAATDIRPLTGIVFVLRGNAAVRCAELADSAPAARDAFLVHSARPAEVRWQAGSGCLVLLMPTDAIVGLGIDADALPVTLEGTPLLAATRAFALTLGGEQPAASRYSSYVAERLLAGMAFSLVLEGSEAVSELQRTGLADRARAIMLLRRTDLDLTPISIAEDLHISPRQLQRVFAREGQTPAAALRHLRIELAESMLRDPQFDGLSVNEVARASGFASASVLRRALEAESVAAPRMLRRTRSVVLNSDI